VVSLIFTSSVALRFLVFALAIALSGDLFAQTPSISGLIPDTAIAGSSGFGMTVFGSNFQGQNGSTGQGATIIWNNTPLNTTVETSVGLQAFVPASLIRTAGTAQIGVQNPGPVSSNTFTFTIRTTPAIPNLTGADTTFNTTGLTPKGVNKAVYVGGTGIQPGAILSWNGVNLASVFPAYLALLFAVPDSLMQSPGTAVLTLTNPGGSPSNSLNLVIPAVRTLTSMSPSTIAPGGAGFTLTVNGSNFAPGDRVVALVTNDPYTLAQPLPNGHTNGLMTLGTQFISSSQLQASIPASDVATAGSGQVAVVTIPPAAGTGSFYSSLSIFSSANSLTFTVGAPGCTYTLSSTTATVGTAASTGSVQVVTQPGCAWTASSPSNSVTITAGASGTGNGAVNYNVAASNAAQTTTLTIAGQSFTIIQLSGCLFGLTPSSAAVAATGGGGSFSVGALGTACSWTAASNATWLLASGAGPGNGTVNYTASPNPSTVGRSGTITAGGETFTVVQAGNAPCTYSLQQASQAFPTAGGKGTADVQTPAGCTWTANSNVQWLTIAGTTNTTATYTVAANPATTARTGSLTIAGLTYSVTQAGTSSNVTCSAGAPAPPQVALEGRTEVLGDLELSCTGLSGPVTADISLTLNTDVTNTLTSGSTTDALLLVDEANAQNGQIQGYNTLRFPGVSLVADSSGTATVRITNVRADASLLTAPSNLQSVAVTGLVDVESQVPVPVTNAQLTMANAAPTLVFQPGTAASLRLPLVFEEATPAAFQVGTRLRLVLSNIPAGDTVFVPVYPSEGASKAQLYSADANGAGGSPVTGTPLNGLTYQQLVVTNGTATATWVVLSANPGQLETLTFLLLLGSGTESDLTQIQATGSLAPVSTVGVASATAPVPRYRDFSVPQKLVNLRVSTSVGASAPKVQLRPLASTAGSNVTFTTTVVNDDSTQTATNVTVRDDLSTGSTVVSCASSDGQSCGSGNQAAVTYGTLAPGASETVTVTVAPGASWTDGSVLDNDVGVSSDDPNATLSGTSASTSSIVLNGVPVTVGDQPASGAGSNQPFTFQFSHPDGYLNLGVVDVLINSVLDARHACYLAYSLQYSTLYLIDDAGDAGGPYAGSLPLGSSGSIQNSQCTVGLTSAVGSGTTLTLTLNITFQPGFGGDRIFYVAAADFVQHNTNWQALGVWQVPGPAATGTIAVSSVTPARATASSGTPQTLTVTLTDSKGTGDFGVVNVLINNAIDGRQACYLAYVASSNTLYLVDDAGDAGGPFAGGMVLNGGSGSIQNSQCVVNGTGSTVTPSPGTLALALNATFTGAFKGNRIVYIAGRDSAGGNNTDWQAAGTFTVQ